MIQLLKRGIFHPLLTPHWSPCRLHPIIKTKQLGRPCHGNQTNPIACQKGELFLQGRELLTFFSCTQRCTRKAVRGTPPWTAPPSTTPSMRGRSDTKRPFSMALGAFSPRATDKLTSGFSPSLIHSVRPPYVWPIRTSGQLFCITSITGTKAGRWSLRLIVKAVGTHAGCSRNFSMGNHLRTAWSQHTYRAWMCMLQTFSS